MLTDSTPILELTENPNYLQAKLELMRRKKN